MNNKGFVKIPREITNKPWYSSSNTLKVYIELLINAAWKEFEYNGTTLKKGQFITSLGRLAARCKLSIQQTRTALAHLKSTNDITVETTSKFSIITVLDNSLDDEDNKPVDNLANNQSNTSPNNRKRKEEREDKKEIKEIEEAAAPLSSPSHSPDSSITRDDLIQRYGVENVLLYEGKLTAWKNKKGITDGINDINTIAKWLSEDNVKKPKSSSFEMDEVMRKIISRYRI